MRCYQNRELMWIPYIFGAAVAALLYMLVYLRPESGWQLMSLISILMIVFIALTIILNRVYSRLEELTEQIEIILTDQEHRIAYDHSEGTLPNLTNELRKLQKAVSYNLEMREHDRRQVNAFMENMAHQLKTTVTALCIRLELAVTREKNEKQQRTLEQCMFHVDRITSDLNRILENSRLEAGQIKMDSSRCDIHKILCNVKENLQPMAGKKQVEICLSCKGNPTLHGDAYWLYQAFENIVKNGIEYSGTGHKLHVLEKDSGGEKHILIKDYGKGIDEEALPHLFRRFYSGYGDTKGYGLGLNMAKKISEQHHGSIMAGNHSEGGAYFLIKLPMYEGALPYEKVRQVVRQV